MIVTGKAIPRRAVLRGMGVTLALPLLDGMIPAFASQQESIARLSVVFAPNGVNVARWTPANEGTGFALSPTLEPVAAFKDRLVVLSGLDNSVGDPRPGEASTAPHGAPAAFLTSAHRSARVSVGISVDSRAGSSAANAIASLALGINSTHVGQAKRAELRVHPHIVVEDATTPLR